MVSTCSYYCIILGGVWIWKPEMIVFLLGGQICIYVIYQFIYDL